MTSVTLYGSLSRREGNFDANASMSEGFVAACVASIAAPFSYSHQHENRTFLGAFPFRYKGVLGECLRHGIKPETHIDVIGDGASWIRAVQRKMFPGSRYTLDMDRLQDGTRQVLAERQYRHFCSLVWSRQPQQAVRYVERLLPSDPEHSQELGNFCACIERKIDGMYYDRSGPVGSGVVEKAADIIVSRRMKRRGMTWSREGGNNLVALRTLALNQSRDHRWEIPQLPHFLGCNPSRSPDPVASRMFLSEG